MAVNIAKCGMWLAQHAYTQGTHSHIKYAVPTVVIRIRNAEPKMAGPT